MKLTYIKSATCVIKDGSKSILMDPWLVNGEYYGSWFHQKTKDICLKNIKNINYIYISHIHPDHFSEKH